MEGYKVLVVDDEPDILEILSFHLRGAGYRVSAASNGQQALDLAAAERPDLIILDIMMPEMDGVEVCRRLRALPEFQHTLIAFLTARDEDYSQIAALDVGGDDYITKPIRPRVFLSRVQALLRRAGRGEEAQEPIIRLGELTIDRERVLVFKGEQAIELPKKEFELLSLLAGKPGKVFSREDIFKKVWGPDVIVGERTIDVHIRKLREKIGEGFIKTIKGIGYKFEF